ETPPLSLHDALPIWARDRAGRRITWSLRGVDRRAGIGAGPAIRRGECGSAFLCRLTALRHVLDFGARLPRLRIALASGLEPGLRSEEHTSELQSREK